jgi:hypothetical protein
MSQDSNFERLLSMASGPAVDILFKKTNSIGYGIKNLPSEYLIEEKWKTLSVDSANTLAIKINNPILIDKLLIKEKRKTIKRSLASNKALSRETRLYLLQEALIESDRELATYSLNGFPLCEVLEMLSADESLQSYVNYDSIFKSGESPLDLDSLSYYLSKLSSRSLNGFLNKALSNNFNLGVQLIRLSGIDKYDYSGYQRLNLESATLESIQTFLGFLSEKHASEFLYKCWDENPSYLRSMGKEAIEKIVPLICNLNMEMIKTLHEYNILDTVLKSNRSVRYDTDKDVEYILSLGISIDSKVSLLLNNHHLFDELDWEIEPALIAKLGFELYPDLTVNWLNSNYGKMDLKFIIETLDLYPNNSINARTLTSIARSYDISIDKLISMVSDKVLLNLDTLPRIEDYQPLILRLEKLKGFPTLDLYESALNNEKNTNIFSFSIAKKLLDLEPSKLYDWLRSVEQSKELEEFILSNEEAILKILSSTPKLINCDWVIFVIDKIYLKNGLNGIYADNLLDSIMKYLSIKLESNKDYWENALSLINNWSGTLNELAEASKNL